MTVQPQDQSLVALFLSTFWLPALFVVPLITMRSFAEERKCGTLETLMMAPVSVGEVVFAKFLAVYVFYTALWMMTLFYPYVTLKIAGGNVGGVFEVSSLLGGYAFVAMSGLLYVAIGIFASCLTRSQPIAGMLSFGMLFVAILGGRIMGELNLPVAVIEALGSPLGDYFNTFQHLQDFTRGMIDSRALGVYATFSFLFLGLTVILTEPR